MTSNKVVNLNKVRAASNATRPELAVLVFDYYAPQSGVGQVEQRPLVKVVNDSLSRLDDGDWVFKGVNLYRVGETNSGSDRGVRTYRLSRINGIARKP
jgi:hypothetical protein